MEAFVSCWSLAQEIDSVSSVHSDCLRCDYRAARNGVIESYGSSLPCTVDSGAATSSLKESRDVY